MAMTARCALNARITFACIGIFVGLSIFVMFGFEFENWDTAVWGLASAVFASITLGTHLTFRYDEWTTRPNLLIPLAVVGCIGQLGAIAATAAYISLAIIQQQNVTARGKAYYVSAVWAAMTWKWAFLLFFYSIKYKRTQHLSINADSSTPYQRVSQSDD